MEKELTYVAPPRVRSERFIGANTATCEIGKECTLRDARLYTELYALLCRERETLLSFLSVVADGGLRADLTVELGACDMLLARATRALGSLGGGRKRGKNGVIFRRIVIRLLCVADASTAHTAELLLRHKTRDAAHLRRTVTECGGENLSKNAERFACEVTALGESGMFAVKKYL